jgi:hypothetical protein
MTGETDRTAPERPNAVIRVTVELIADLLKLPKTIVPFADSLHIHRDGYLELAVYSPEIAPVHDESTPLRELTPVYHAHNVSVVELLRIDIRSLIRDPETPQ